jgi:hypothetical protein
VISGSVDLGFAGTQCPADNSAPYPGNVYLFGPIAAGAADSTVQTDDYDGIASDPNGADALVSAMVDPNTGNYTIGFLAPGRYKVAYTCDRDDVEVDADTDAVEDVEFTPADGIAVNVVSNAVTDVDFPPPAP